MSWQALSDALEGAGAAVIDSAPPHAGGMRRAGRRQLSLRIRAEIQLPLSLQKGFIKAVGLLWNNDRCYTNQQPWLLT